MNEIDDGYIADIDESNDYIEQITGKKKFRKRKLKLSPIPVESNII